MGDLTIRSIERDELPAFMRALDMAFHGDGSQEMIEFESLIAEPDRYFVAEEDARFVGTAGAVSTQLTVPGGVVRAPGVTAVGVLASHRRRGINTRLMATLLDQAAERGEPLAYLWASESPIYGRFGYGMASLCAELEMPTDQASFVDGVKLTGRVDLLPRDEALALMRPAYDRAALARPGMVAADDRFWTWLFHPQKKDADEPRFFAVHLDEHGQADGYSVYRVKHDWTHGVPRNELKVDHMVCATAAAEASLWRYLFDVDLIATVKAWDRPPDDSVLWLVAHPRRLRFTVADGLWVRIVDVDGALGARRYSMDGRLVIDVEDAFRPQTSGRYELVVSGGTGVCTKSDADADIACTARALGAVYLGGTSFSQLSRVQQARELTVGAVARADAMFAWDPAPWFGFVF
jgi:predicted acetyltransferase